MIRIRSSVRFGLPAIVILILRLTGCKDDANSLPPMDPFWARTDLDSATVLAISSSPKGDLFAGTSDTRRPMMRSADDGKHWAQHVVPTSNAIYAIGFSAAGVGMAASYDGTLSRLIRTIDSGRTWQSIGYAETVLVRTFTSNSLGHIFFGSTGGVYRSTDAGTTWRKMNTARMSVNALTILFNGFLFAASDEGGFRSTDFGVTWSRSDFGLPVDVVLATASSSGGVLLASTCGDAVYRSYDYGVFWQHTSLRIPCVGILATNPAGYFFAGKGGSPPQEEPGSMFISTDTGISWTRITTGLSDLDLVSFGASPSGHVFVGTTNGGLFRSVKSVDNFP